MKKAIFLASALIVTACFSPSREATREEPEHTAEEYVDFSRVPLQSEITGVQPMTGLVLWNTNSHAKSWPVQLEFSYMLYNEVCRQKGEYDWSVVDRLLDDVSSRGHQAILRFRYTYVGKKCSVPDWIKALPDYEETVGKSEGQTTYFPDWRCPELQDFHKEFHQKFAERYDKDPRLAFVQTGFGLWAEYHIYDGPFKPGRTFPSKEFQTEFFKAMDGWFEDCTWSISIDAADDTYSPFSRDAQLMGLRFGNFDDSFMCEGHDGYNWQSWKTFGEERYRTAPFGGEFSYYTSYDQKHCIDESGMHGRIFEDEAAKYHMTYILANDQPQYQTKDRFKQAAMSMGYSFTVKDLRVKGNVAAVCIENSGVAPIYRDAFVAVNGVRSLWSLKNLMPGQSRWVEVSDSSVSEDACKVSIECDHLVAGQKIEFNADIK